MNIHLREAGAGASEAADLLDRLRRWAGTATPDEIAALAPAVRDLLPAGAGEAPLSSDYPHDFAADAAYRATLPDLQNGPESLIRGDRRRIEHVGISNFRLPVRFATRGGDVMTLEASVTGTVSLEGDKKGINMSRVMRSFYVTAREAQSFAVIDRALDAYMADLETREARIMMRLSYPMEVESLRSGLSGWQFYDVALEVLAGPGGRTRILHLDYVYSSTCPCSLELSEHARRTRGQLATPHSQRSVARVSVALGDGGDLPVEDLVEICRAAVPTETQVMVKREDEQAFAELNAANPIFVEDAARLFARGLGADPRIGDFRVASSHQESLHSHDAVSVLTEGETFADRSLDPGFFASLHHPG